MQQRRTRCRAMAGLIYLCAAALLLACAGRDNIIPASEIPTGTLTVTWEAVPGALAYNLYLGGSPGLTKWNCVKLPAADPPKTISDLAWGRTFFVGLSVVTGTGEGEILIEKSYTVRTKGGSLHLGVPAVERAFTPAPWQPTGDRQVTLAWDDVPGALHYNLYVSESPGVNRQTGARIAGTSNPYTIKGLKAGTTYYVVITAVTPQGESPPLG